jgi:hypothetical protein
MIRAAPGCVLYGADFSAIESRVLAWIAGEKWKIETYRRFDDTGDPTLEPYCVTATRILKRTITPTDEAGRQIGKICDLSFGYGGGLGAFRRFDNSDTYTDDQVNIFKAKWRNAHSATTRFWRAVENALCRALRTRQRTTLDKLTFEVCDGTLYLTLPSGRRLAYPEARLEPGKFPGTQQIVFKDNARGGWSDVRGWQGTFTENVVQAIARDLLAAAMQRLEAAGYPVTLHCHDECVCEVPEGFSSTEQFLQLMIALPDWATGLPLAAKAWTRVCYAKPQPAPKPSAPAPPKVEEPAPKVNGSPALPAVAAILTPLQQQEQISLIDLIGQPLRDGKIICPFHADSTPSLHIYPDHYHCFACGAHGDHVDWLMMVEGMNRNAALRVLKTWNGPTAPRRRTDDDKNARTLALASQIWKTAKPIAGTPAIKYLAEVRRLNPDVLPDDVPLRFHPRCPFGPGVRVPCLIALYRDVETDAPAGIHRIALTPEVFAGGKVQRRSLGCWPTPRAIKLWPAADQLFLGEGIETVLAAATRLEHRDAPMRPAWAAGSSINISKFPVIGIKQLTLLVDHDEAGKACANTCRQRWKEAGREVVRLLPEREGADFNDVVLERFSHEG